MWPEGSGSVGDRRVVGAVMAVLVLAGFGAAPVAAGVVDGDTTTSGVAGAGAAGSVEQEASPDVCGQNADALVEKYNDNIGDVPSLVKDRVSNSEVHGKVNGPGGGHYTFVTDSQGRVQSYSEGKPASPKLHVVTDCESFASMATADDPSAAFWREYRAGDVDFVGTGIVGSIVVDGVELVASFGDRISRFTGLGFGESVATAGVILVLAFFVVVPLFTYVAYRRVWMIRNRRRRRRQQREE